MLILIILRKHDVLLLVVVFQMYNITNIYAQYKRDLVLLASVLK